MRERVLVYTLGARLDDARARFISKRLLKLRGVERVSVSPARREVTVRGAVEPSEVRDALAEAGFPPEPERLTLFSERLGSWRWARAVKGLREKVLELRANPLTGLLTVKFDGNEVSPEEALGPLRALDPVPSGSGSLIGERLRERLVKGLLWGILGLAFGLGAWWALLMGRLNLSATLGTLGYLLLAYKLRKERDFYPLLLGALALGLGFWERLSGGPGFFHLVPLGLSFRFLLSALLARHRLRFLKPLWELQSRLPKKATVLRKEGAEECDAQELEPGEVVLVKPGEPVPADGLDEEGRWRRQGEPGDGFRLTVVHPYRLSYQVRLLAGLEEALSAGAPSFWARLSGNLLGLAVASALGALWLPAASLALLPWGEALQALLNLPRARLALRGFRKGLVLKPRSLRRWAWLRSLVLPLGSALGPYRGEMPPEAEALVGGLAGKLTAQAPPAKGRVLYPEEGVEAEGWRFGYVRFVGLGSFREHTLLFPVFLRSPEGDVKPVFFRRDLRDGVRELVKKFKRRYLLTSAPRTVAEAWARELGGFTGFFPESSPGGKLSAVEELELRGKRVLYFDDEPYRYDILRAAHLGVALAEGFFPLEADAVSLGSSVEKVLLPRTLAKRALASSVFRLGLWGLGLACGLLVGFSPEALALAGLSLLLSAA